MEIFYTQCILSRRWKSKYSFVFYIINLLLKYQNLQPCYSDFLINGYLRMPIGILRPDIWPGPGLSVLWDPGSLRPLTECCMGPQGPSELHVFLHPASLGSVGQIGSQPPVPTCLLAKLYHDHDHQTHNTQSILEQILIISPKWKQIQMSDVHTQPIMIVLQSP